jgi:GT2 family glycosyltransferase
VVACVTSVLASTGFTELIVVDQSDGPESELALSRLFDPRLRYVRTPTRGVTSGRNVGIELSRGDVIVFTDDDCRVAADWVPTLTNIFATDPEAAVVCGRVRVPDDVRQSGFTESFEPRVREWKGRFPPFGTDWGITANLAVRRDVVERIGRFDPVLGAGGPLRSGGEPDFLFRVLRSGYKIVNAREVVVDHLGVRAPGKESQRLIRGYGIGTGAALFKHVRLGDAVALRVYLGFIGANLRRISLSLLNGSGPVGLGYLLAFLSGSITSCRFRIDRDLRQYVGR